jgi:hypothetical protein
MRVYAAKTAKTTTVTAAGGQFRDQYGTVVTNDHPLDLTAPVDQEAYLTVDFK